MRTSTLLRVAIGLFFMTAGFVKTKKLGKRFVPKAWKIAEKGFKDMDRALKDFPGRDDVKVTAAEAQELFGYVDLICGFLIMTGNMVGLASFTLLIETAGLEYTLFIMKAPVQYMAVVGGLILALASICFSGGSKEKTD